jgi:hypothetical protein
MDIIWERPGPEGYIRASRNRTNLGCAIMCMAIVLVIIAVFVR